MYAWFMRCGECDQPTRQMDFIKYIGYNFSGHDGHLYPTPEAAYVDRDRFYKELETTVNTHKGVIPKHTPHQIVTDDDRCKSPDYRRSDAEMSEQYRTRGGHWTDCPFECLDDEISYFCQSLVLVTVGEVR